MGWLAVGEFGEWLERGGVMGEWVAEERVRVGYVVGE